MKYLKTYEQNKGITLQQWLKDKPQDINITYINCFSSNLIDLNGIEQFIKLEYLDCCDNKLTELPDLSNNINLEELFCDNNQLTELPDLNNNINLRIYVVLITI